MINVCGDNRFEIIREAKEALIASTNITQSPKEMAVLNDFLFRCWQMGWLEKYEQQPTSDGWIPVSGGQMPPIDKEVWITYTYPNGFCDCSFAHLGKDGEWYSKNFGLRLSRDRITAWQSLPQPYKESE